MRTYCQDWRIETEDKTNPNILAQLVLANLKKGEKLKIGSSGTFEVTTTTDTTLRLKSETKCLSFKIRILNEYGLWICNIPTYTKGDMAAQVLRDLEGDLILDMLNVHNPFHELTDAGKILRRDPIYN
jgi:hypothetical protein